MVDIKKIEEATRLLIEAIGEDAARDGLVETPKRVARLFAEVLSGRQADIDEILGRVFDVSGDADTGIVIEKDIDFHSLCEHHLLPFFGRAHIAYLPDKRVLGLSKLARIVDAFAKRVQLQEQMTNQIADAIYGAAKLDCKGVLVLLEAQHMCMSMRGVKKIGAKTITLAKRGVFETDKALMAQAMELIKALA